MDQSQTRMSEINSEWTPGRPVATPQDHAALERWKRDRKREQQRQRRAKLRRIDYYPSAEAAKIIDANTRPVAYCDYSGLLNRIVSEWASGIK
jgi:hypothetical protein